MMPLPDVHSDPTNYKKKYKALKRKLRLLVYEQECFLEELRKAQRKLLAVSRDKSFLLDRLLQYEKVEELSSDSDMTASSDSDNDVKEANSGKKRKLPSSQALFGISAAKAASMAGLQEMTASQLSSVLGNSASGEPVRKKVKLTKKAAAKLSAGRLPANLAHAMAEPHAGHTAGHMTREELERHLEMKQSHKTQFMSIESAPYSLPDDIFECSNPERPASELLARMKEEEESDLVIDLPI